MIVQEYTSLFNSLNGKEPTKLMTAHFGKLTYQEQDRTIAALNAAITNKNGG